MGRDLNRCHGHVWCVLLLMGCAEPFTVERHALGPPRLAAMGVWEGTARAAIWSGQGAWHSESPELSWTLDGQPLGTGFEVAVDRPGTLGLEATLADGTALRGTVTVAEGVTVDVLRQVVTRPSDLSLASRLRVGGPEPRVGSADRYDMMRLTALRSDGQTGALRWMLGADDWSVLELQANAADVVPAAVRFQDGEIESVLDGAAGIAPLLVLSIDGRGHNGWTWTDVAFDVPGPLISVQGHLFPLSPETATDEVLSWASGPLSHVVATLEADPTGEAPAGVRLVDVEAGLVLETDLGEFPSPDCAPSDGGFLLWTVAEGRCAIPDIDGARVVLELR